MQTNRIFSFHLDLIGLFRLGRSNEERIKSFNNLIDQHFVDKGSTVLIPTYSYSYTSGETYDVNNSVSKVGFVTESMRNLPNTRRTIDPIFSYMVKGDGISRDNFVVRDYECFGDNSLMSELYEKDSMVCSIAAPWDRVFTEVHFIERLLGMKYRKNKTFQGETVDASGLHHKTSAVFYCRDYEYNLRSGHLRLAEDLMRDDLIETINIEDKIEIKGVSFKNLYEYVAQKVKTDYLYLCEEV